MINANLKPYFISVADQLSDILTKLNNSKINEAVLKQFTEDAPDISDPMQAESVNFEMLYDFRDKIRDKFANTQLSLQDIADFAQKIAFVLRINRARNKFQLNLDENPSIAKGVEDLFQFAASIDEKGQKYPTWLDLSKVLKSQTGHLYQELYSFIPESARIILGRMFLGDYIARISYELAPQRLVFARRTRIDDASQLHAKLNEEEEKSRNSLKEVFNELVHAQSNDPNLPFFDNLHRPDGSVEPKWWYVKQTLDQLQYLNDNFDDPDIIDEILPEGNNAVVEGLMQCLCLIDRMKKHDDVRPFLDDILDKLRPILQPRPLVIPRDPELAPPDIVSVKPWDEPTNPTKEPPIGPFIVPVVPWDELTNTPKEPPHRSPITEPPSEPMTLQPSPYVRLPEQEKRGHRPIRNRPNPIVAQFRNNQQPPTQNQARNQSVKHKYCTNPITRMQVQSYMQAKAAILSGNASKQPQMHIISANPLAIYISKNLALHLGDNNSSEFIASNFIPLAQVVLYNFINTLDGIQNYTLDPIQNLLQTETSSGISSVSRSGNHAKPNKPKKAKIKMKFTSSNLLVLILIRLFFALS